jgi:hypothetical protein
VRAVEDWRYVDWAVPRTVSLRVSWRIFIHTAARRWPANERCSFRYYRWLASSCPVVRSINIRWVDGRFELACLHWRSVLELACLWHERSWGRLQAWWEVPTCISVLLFGKLLTSQWLVTSGFVFKSEHIHFIVIVKVEHLLRNIQHSDRDSQLLFTNQITECTLKQATGLKRSSVFAT